MKNKVYILTEFTGCCGVEILTVKGTVREIEEYAKECEIDLSDAYINIEMYEF